MGARLSHWTGTAAGCRCDAVEVSTVAFFREKPSSFSPAEDLAAAPLLHFFCFAASVPLCWPDRHSRQHSPAWFRLVHDGEGEGEVGGAGGGRVEKVGRREAAAWCLAHVWTQA